ncbi:MAG: hypothetical protein BRD30_10090 [Bacteroidetes bacterium QH_2_63_10]|nr:MAG: hypothetical protein BRD30_10090 [Bacteroidetes bacterium QH_2_63_10]
MSPVGAPLSHNGVALFSVVGLFCFPDGCPSHVARSRPRVAARVCGCGSGAGQPTGPDNTSESDTSRAASDKEQAANWLLLPFASYAPATELAGGIVAGYYRPARPDRPSSSVQVTLEGTQRRQFTV